MCEILARSLSNKFISIMLFDFDTVLPVRTALVQGSLLHVQVSV